MGQVGNWENGIWIGGLILGIMGMSLLTGCSKQQHLFPKREKIVEGVHDFFQEADGENEREEIKGFIEEQECKILEGLEGMEKEIPNQTQNADRIEEKPKQEESMNLEQKKQEGKDKQEAKEKQETQEPKTQETQKQETQKQETQKQETQKQETQKQKEQEQKTPATETVFPQEAPKQERTDENRTEPLKEGTQHLFCTYDEGHIIQSPSCVSQGLLVYSCVICGQEKKEILPAKGHDLFETWWEKPDCTYSGSGHGNVCKRCDYWEPLPEKALGHEVVVGEIWKQPDCMHEGYQSQSCIRCGATLPDLVLLADPSFHIWHLDEEGWYCGICSATK